jgi:hypothetical protein
MHLKQDRSTCELWSDDYFMDMIERKIKNEIDVKFFVHHHRKPTKHEYESIFADWVSKLNCQVTDFDLGIYES